MNKKLFPFVLYEIIINRSGIKLLFIIKPGKSFSHMYNKAGIKRCPGYIKSYNNPISYMSNNNNKYFI